MTPRRIALLITIALSATGLLGVGSASAAPIWNLDIHHHETHFPPGGTADYWFDVDNVGDTDSSGTVTLTVNLLGGITGNVIREAGLPQAGSSWSCPSVAGLTTVTCTTKGPIGRHSLNRNLILTVNIPPSASGDRFATAKVQGGGAALTATALEKAHISPDPAGFGFVEDSFAPDFFKADGLSLARRAGSHPDLAVFPFDFNSVSAPTAIRPHQKAEADSVRDLVVDLPPGFIGNPTAVGECTPAELSFAECPRSSQVGRIDITVAPIGSEPYRPLSVGVFNMVHPRGAVTDLAFTYAGVPVHVMASLDPANQYAIRTSVSNVNETLPPFSQKLTVWGVPAAASHDSERCHGKGSEEIDTSSSCPTDATLKPYLALPSQCESDNAMRLHHYDSWQNTGVFGPDITYTLPGKMTDCHLPRFEPEVEIEPTGKQANTPTGLDVHIKVAQNETPTALATPPVKRTTVTLPEGMSFSPSFADGLQSCTLAQMKLGTNEPIECPDASRIGEVELSTPLLPEEAVGSMYLAAQGDNPFGSTFGLYLVLEDTEERGVLIKIPGRIDVDPVSGRITTVFDDLPQFPFDDMTLKFRSGPRAPLVSPPSCGTQTIGVELASYAQPQDPVDVSNTYEVTEGPNGTPCPNAGNRPFGPELSAGTLNPVAGSYSPFLFRLSREDQEQELASVKATLPPGLVAKIAGVSFCPEQAIASISTAEGAGAGEAASPACPSSSQIGTLSAGLGAGPGPNYFPGKAYLAGPYKGAPLSLAVVAPALAGPFDLGNVVVRAALRVDSETAQVTAVSDSFPTILHGVILRTRDVRLRVDRPDTTINPTNCGPMAVEGEVGGAGGAIFNTRSPFQVGSCGDLGFAPKLSFRLLGGTRRGAHPRLKATLRMPPGGANIAKASVALPRSEFLDQSHIGTVCTRVQFASDSCPAASIYGKVEAKTPLLDEVLSGPIYLRSSDNLLPDLVAAFRGGRVDFDLVGRIDSVNQGIRNTFDLTPDVPVSWVKFAFLGGKKGLLVNSRDLCKQAYRATAKFKAHNGDAITLRPPMANSCKKKGRKAGRSSRSR